jgi:hypothetical protein
MKHLFYGLLFATLSFTACSIGDIDPVDEDDGILEQAAIPSSTIVPAGAVLVSTTDVNLRAGPAKTYSVLDVVTQGDRVTVVETSGTENYLHLDYNGTVGWSHRGYYEVVSLPDPDTDPTYDELAAQYGVLLVTPANLDITYAETIWFLQTGSAKLNPAPLTEAEGRDLYFLGLIPQASSRAAFKAAAMHHGAFPSWARSAPCAYSSSEVLESAGEKAGLDSVVDHFEHHDDQAVTHAVEIQLRNLGWTYYRKTDYLAPRGAIGMWSRYTFSGWKQHSGHVYTILVDNGPDGRADRIADNEGNYDHVYTPSGKCVGFWLPPGVYPRRR